MCSSCSCTLYMHTPRWGPIAASHNNQSRFGMAPVGAAYSCARHRSQQSIRRLRSLGSIPHDTRSFGSEDRGDRRHRLLRDRHLRGVPEAQGRTPIAWGETDLPKHRVAARRRGEVRLREHPSAGQPRRSPASRRSEAHPQALAVPGLQRSLRLHSRGTDKAWKACRHLQLSDDGAALRHGATQFKVNFRELREVINESEWAKKNILIAVAGGAGDGTSGVRQAADATVRQEIEKFAHIIFSSSPAQREFWLGQRVGMTIEELRARYDGCKPCLHGSDSHDQKSVGQPIDNRFSWIKGALEFDSLRQACIDPEGRAYVGDQPPRSAMPSQVISHVRIDDADWAATPDIPLNPGLSGHHRRAGFGQDGTCRCDRSGLRCNIAPGWEADENVSPSFLARARRLIGDATDDTDLGRRRHGDARTRRPRRQRSHVVSPCSLSFAAVRRRALLREGCLGWSCGRDRAGNFRVTLGGRSRLGESTLPSCASSRPHDSSRRESVKPKQSLTSPTA